MSRPNPKTGAHVAADEVERAGEGPFTRIVRPFVLDQLSDCISRIRAANSH